MLHRKLSGIKKALQAAIVLSHEEKTKTRSMIAEILQKPSNTRTEAELLYLIQSTEKIKFFSELTQQNQGDQEIHRQCCQYMTYEKHNIGHKVISIGEVGDKFYIILSGRVSIYIKEQEESLLHEMEEINLNDKEEIDNQEQKDGEEEKEGEEEQENEHGDQNKYRSQRNISHLKQVGQMFPGSSFGELALLSLKPRMATIVCEAKSEFFVLKKKDFDKTLKNKKQLNEKLHYLESLPFLVDVRKDYVRDIYSRAEYINFVANQSVFKEESDPTAVYIVLKGTFIGFKKFYIQPPTENDLSQKRLQQQPILDFNVYEKRNEFKMMNLITIGINELFGEEEIILGTKRRLTVICQSVEGELIVIKKNQFVSKVLQEYNGAKYMKKSMEHKQEVWDHKMKQTQANVDKFWNLLREDRQQLKINQELKKESISRRKWAESVSETAPIQQQPLPKSSTPQPKSSGPDPLNMRLLNSSNDQSCQQIPSPTNLQRNSSSSESFNKRSKSLAFPIGFQNSQSQYFENPFSQDFVKPQHQGLSYTEMQQKSNQNNIFEEQQILSLTTSPNTQFKMSFFNQYQKKPSENKTNQQLSDFFNGVKDPLKFISKHGEQKADPLTDNINLPHDYQPANLIVSGENIEEISSKKLSLKNPYKNYLQDLKKQNPPLPIHMLKKRLAKKYKYQSQNIITSEYSVQNLQESQFNKLKGSSTSIKEIIIDNLDPVKEKDENSDQKSTKNAPYSLLNVNNFNSDLIIKYPSQSASEVLSNDILQKQTQKSIKSSAASQINCGKSWSIQDPLQFKSLKQIDQSPIQRKNVVSLHIQSSSPSSQISYAQKSLVHQSSFYKNESQGSFMNALNQLNNDNALKFKQIEVIPKDTPTRHKIQKSENIIHTIKSAKTSSDFPLPKRGFDSTRKFDSQRGSKIEFGKPFPKISFPASSFSPQAQQPTEGTRPFTNGSRGAKKIPSTSFGDIQIEMRTAGNIGDLGDILSPKERGEINSEIISWGQLAHPIVDSTNNNQFSRNSKQRTKVEVRPSTSLSKDHESNSSKGFFNCANANNFLKSATLKRNKVASQSLFNPNQQDQFKSQSNPSLIQLPNQQQESTTSLTIKRSNISPRNNLKGVNQNKSQTQTPLKMKE